MRKKVWLIPPIAPTNADEMIAAGIIGILFEHNVYDNKERGAIFWIVIKIITWGHCNPSITLGNQKWNGAAPDFNKRATVINIMANSLDDNMKEEDIMMTEEPNAWIKKYFRAASEEYWLFLEEIKGIKDIRFSSSPIQAPNQDEEEMERSVPKDREVRNKICEEESKIKKRGS